MANDVMDIEDLTGADITLDIMSSAIRHILQRITVIAATALFSSRLLWLEVPTCTRTRGFLAVVRPRLSAIPDRSLGSATMVAWTLGR